MDTTAFDGLTRLMASGASRRGLIGALGALTAGGSLSALLGVADADAKRKRKKKKKTKKTDKNGNQSPPPPGLTCSDGVKNGSETDVDCGGGTCPRCAGGQICTNRNDCHTALCVASTCQSCAQPTDCGLDSDGVTTCFCRDNAEKPGERMCTKQTCNLIPGGTCDQCAPGEQCAPAGPGAIECCKPCGA